MRFIIKLGMILGHAIKTIQHFNNIQPIMFTISQNQNLKTFL